MEAETEKRRPGRPAGSKNKRVAKIGPPNPNRPGSDYQYADPETLVARQFTLIDTAQQWLSAEMAAIARGEGELAGFDIRRLHELSQALSRTIESLKRSSDCAEEMAKRLSPEQLLEAAIKKIEAQDRATVEYAIKRLREVRRDISEEAPQTATSAIAELLDGV
jgi:hypothetical protein